MMWCEICHQKTVHKVCDSCLQRLINCAMHHAQEEDVDVFLRREFSSNEEEDM